jgi:HEAT repeat protein
MLLPKISTVLIGVILLLPFAITFLKMVLKDGPDPSTQAEFERMSKEMRIESDPPAAIRLLLPMADSSDPVDRADAAWLLGFVHANVPPEIFLRLAKDNFPEVRRAACGSLASLKGHESAFQMLISSLDDTDETVRISAISSLGSLGDVRALPLLERIVPSSSEDLRLILDHAISSLKHGSGDSPPAR